LVAWPYIKPWFISGQPPIPSAQVTDFTADPPQIEEGGSTTLSWKTQNAQQVTLSTEEDAAGEIIAPAGTKIVRPQGTTVFFLKAKGTDPEKKVDVARITVTVTPPAAKPNPQIVVFEADRKVLTRGDSTALHWETVHASRIELDDATVKPSGAIKIRPDQTTTYRLTAINESGKSDSGAITITVEDLPRDEIAEIQELLVTLGFDAGTADGLPGPRTRTAIEAFQKESGLPVTGLPSRDLAERLRETHGSVPAPQILVFKSDRRKIARGETLNLRWETANAEKVSLNPLGNVEASGERLVRPPDTTEYELVATNRVGRSVRETIAIQAEVPLKIESLTVDRPRIGPNDKTAIQWRTSGAERVELIPFGEVSPTGSKTVSPAETTTYILTAWGSEKQATRQKVTITVDAATVSGGTIILAGGGKYLDDKRVIYAILYGVPLDGIAAKLFGKVQTIFEFPLGKNKIDAAKYNYDVKRSKTLMAEAGLVKGMGAYMYYTEDLTNLAQVVQNYLKRIGIQVKSRALSPVTARKAAESQIVKTGQPTLLLESIK
jgi:peptidoglycan hydrolase-like protein with peptidoglycan-binding domain